MMKICDECINNLSDELSTEAKDILKNSYYLFVAHEQITSRDLGRDFRFNKGRLEEVIKELKENFLLSSYIYNRRIYYTLTDVGERFIELEKLKEETSIEDMSRDNEQEIDTQEEVSEQEEVSVENLEKEIIKSDENKEEVKGDNTEASGGIEEDQVRKEEGEEAEGLSKDSSKSNKNIVWNFDL